MTERSRRGAEAPERGSDPAAPFALSIVIPAFDERERLPASLDRIAAHLGERLPAVELLVVDDGSRDGTGAAARERAEALGLRLRLLRHEPNRGKGYAARRGMLEARGAAVLLTDADLSVSIDHLERFEARLRRGADAVIGSRHLPGAAITVHQPGFRERLGAGFRSLASRFVVPSISDFTCGFKLFERRAARAVFERQRIDGWGYDVEILLIAHRLGLELAEEPVVWRDDDRTRVRLVRDVVRSAAELLRIKWNDWLGRYAPSPAAAPAGEVGSES
jgi:dolichyl-phosphate beta-glucosyltransferase